MTPFSGGSRGTHCRGRQNVSVPVQAVVVRQMRREEPIRVNPMSQVNVHILPVVRPMGQLMVPLCGAASMGHIRAVEVTAEGTHFGDEVISSTGMFCRMEK